MNDIDEKLFSSDLLSLAGKTSWTRREFVVSSLATGFALAVQPVCAQTVITTDARGLNAGEVKIPVAGGALPAYIAMPEKGQMFPTVLVVQEIFGVHEHIKDVCRRFAKLGYLAIAPELYFRQGDVSQMKDSKEIFARVVSKVPDARVMSDFDAAAAWAEKSGFGDVTRLGITGFCWGGRITWLYVAHNPKVKAAIAWYGPLVRSYHAGDKTVLDVVDRINAPVLGLYGGADAGIPADTVERMRAALKKAGKPSEIVLYPGTPHAFYADYRPSYRKQQAEDGWKRLQQWFKKHGVA